MADNPGNVRRPGWQHWRKVGHLTWGDVIDAIVNPPRDVDLSGFVEFSAAAQMSADGCTTGTHLKPGGYARC